MCFVTTIDSFFLARGLVANFRFRQRHPLSLPQQHPSCCYGNNIPSSAVYSVQDPSHTSQAAWGTFGRQHGAVCFMSDHVLKIMKGDGFQHRKQCVRKANLLAPEKITFCWANLNLLFFWTQWACRYSDCFTEWTVGEWGSVSGTKDKSLCVSVYTSSFGPAQPLAQRKSVFLKGLQRSRPSASHSPPSSADRTHTRAIQ